MDGTGNPASAAYPAELAGLDLFEHWAGAPPLAGVFDPFSFAQRMGAYRQMADALNKGDRFGTDNRRNPLWGLAFQLQWQAASGRLGASTATDGRIDPDAPWAYGNYALCVVPWLGAVAAGLVPGLPVAAAPGPTRFRCDAATFRPGVGPWRRFFEVASEVSPGADQEALRRALWRAHKACLDIVASALSGVDPAPWPACEVAFLRGWCRMVDYLWAATWPTDFDFMAEYGLGVLPDRILTDTDTDTDTVRQPSGLPPQVRRSVRTIAGLDRAPAWRHRAYLRLWRRAMRTRAARADVVAMLDAAFNPNPGNTAARRRLGRYLVLGRLAAIGGPGHSGEGKVPDSGTFPHGSRGRRGAP